jgi:DNA-directed RNA polymerase specialized sigma24 family protein
MRPDLKELIDLSYFKGLTHQEITDLKEMPLGTVKTKIRTALFELKKIFNI